MVAFQKDVQGMAVAFSVMSKQKDLIAFVEEEVNKACKENKLKYYETPAAIFVLEQEMTPENDLLTPTFKKKRHSIKKK